jgi:hypothetical protein
MVMLKDAPTEVGNGLPGWSVSADLGSQQHAMALAGQRQSLEAFHDAVRGLETVWSCPYCQSRTYRVRIIGRPGGDLLRGRCERCGTIGQTFRPRQA